MEFNTRTLELIERLEAFMDEVIYPSESVFLQQNRELNGAGQWPWTVPAVVEEVKDEAKARGLWNLFLPDAEEGAGLTNFEYAPLAEIMGRSGLASEACNCSAPDTGNMEVLVRYGTDAQKQEWLEPLLNGDIRSCFGMTEPDVASSDATNIETEIVRDGDEYVINGRKWWTSGAGDPRCKIMILMGKTDKEAHIYTQQSMILVPMDTPGVTVDRALTVFGYDDAPHGHCEVTLKNVRVPVSNILLGEGRGFEIAQGRLGPGRIHHCMRTIGVAERCLELMIDRVNRRVAFGRPLIKHGSIAQDIARSRNSIDQARLLTLQTAYMMDKHGNKKARKQISMIKVVAPQMALAVIDRAIQAYGGEGVCQDTPLAYAYAAVRTLRIADGPDEVHLRVIARQEVKEHKLKTVRHLVKAKL